MTQRLNWERPGQDDEEFRRYLILALIRSGVCVTLQMRAGAYLFIANLLDIWSVSEEGDPCDEDIFGPELAERLRAVKSEVMRTGKPQLMHTSVNDRHFEFHVDVIQSLKGDDLVMTTIIDLSDERRREQVLRALLREVSHRSKNLLAIILSIASQTAKHSWTLEQFLQKFRGRLFSLAQSQDLVTDSSWQGAYFRDLVQEQTGSYIPGSAERIRVEGRNYMLSSNASLHVGLALHELVVNAASHGSLAMGGPPITVSCEAATLRGQKAIEITWIEPLGPNIKAARPGEELRRHFGSVVLERVVPSSVNGLAEYEILPEQITYRLTFPSSQTE